MWIDDLDCFGADGRMRIFPADFERFWANVHVTDGCWFFEQKNPSSSHINLPLMDDDGQSRPTGAHRIAFFMAYGSIDPDLDVDHLCMTKNCVRPSHLEQVSRGENVRRALEMRHLAWDRGGNSNAFCKNGHPARLFRKIVSFTTPNGNKRLRTRCAKCVADCLEKNRQKYYASAKIKKYGYENHCSKTSHSIFCVNGHRRTRDTVYFESSKANSMRCRICRANTAYKTYVSRKAEGKTGARDAHRCKRGHIMSGPNVLEKSGKRWCVTCLGERTKNKPRQKTLVRAKCRQGHAMHGDNVIVVRDKRCCVKCKTIREKKQSEAQATKLDRLRARPQRR